ncbi:MULTISPECIES: Cthe_2314 family HEPN domain-containing protein [Bacillus cereus group]|uniref:Cthe-2314-like HEPN domain-containing protein n=1 Tax=Bacillus toyonensis TaxID=155322 RepID=A0AB36T564_9BACI|nr:Cthe_2314 family HEPN domain-containing protein [Bacillus toyonensis]PEC09606.1 hypothetical protein CON55_18145 [Bacillus toyonensis]PEN88701.1 hypothetical protein CN551_13165 [Bacillus toyonensis]
MTIKIDLFEFPTKEEMLPLLQESPLCNYKIQSDSFNWTNKELFWFDKLDHQIFTIELASSLNKRIFQLNLGYAYLLYYSNRGISDGEYLFLNNLTDEDWTNKIHFDQNIDSVFQKAFTALDLLAHLLFACFGLKTERKKERKLIRINKSFHNAMSQIKFIDRELYNKLEGIRGAREFQEASKVRNDIVHNQPPYEKWNQKVKHSNGTESMVTKYTPSKRLLEIAQGLLKCIKRIFIIIEDNLNKKIACS